ncbi:MAG: D-lactate dehydrogenase [Patescibacteria group bacterium]|nr:D-lactate dehydrogenase [Patescibacteria group bacterium]
MPKIAFLETTNWEKDYLKKRPEFLSQIELFEEPLTLANVSQFKDYEVISCFINSQFTKDILEQLPNLKLLATRSTGFDHIDLATCQKKKILVAYVPAYGSHTVAEYTFGLLLCLVRKIYQAYHQVRETGSFSLEGLKGQELYGKTIGVIGTGRIGINVIKIARGFEMNILAYDKYPNEELAQQLDFEYVPFEKLLMSSDVITFHVPYNSETHHLLNREKIKLVKKGAVIINTSRGGVIETEALYQAIKSGQLAGAALDVLEEEGDIKEEQELLVKGGNLSSEKLKTVLLNHIFIDLDNVIVTPHNAFQTEEALENIVETTLDTIKSYLAGKPINIVSQTNL